MDEIQWGNVGEWVGAIATTAAVVAALWIARHESRESARNLQEELKHDRHQAKQLLAVQHLAQLTEAISKAHSIIRYFRRISETTRQPVNVTFVREVEDQLATAESTRRQLVGLNIDEDLGARWLEEPIPSPYDHVWVGEFDVPDAWLTMLVTGQATELGNWYLGYEEQLETILRETRNLLTRLNLHDEATT